MYGDNVHKNDNSYNGNIIIITNMNLHFEKSFKNIKNIIYIFQFLFSTFIAAASVASFLNSLFLRTFFSTK